MSNVNINVLRKLAWHYISPTTADACEMSLHELKQFIANNYTPTERQLQLLTNKMGLHDDK